MHTHFSGDSEASPREHIEQAIRMGLDEICFTDHRDFDYPIDTFDLDTDAYFMELSALKNEYVDRITIKIGVEVGLDTDHIDEINAFVAQCPFDYVIGSIHVIHHTEFYYGEFFKGKTKEEALKIIDNYEKMINEEEYDKDLLEELLAYEDIYKQPARKKCATLAILGIKDLIEKQEVIMKEVKFEKGLDEEKVRKISELKNGCQNID